MREHCTLRNALTVLIAGLWLVAFYESWEALTLAAVDAKIPDPRPWPLSVDGFILAMGLMVVVAKRERRGHAVWWPRLGMMSATALSTGIQFGYAPDDVGRGGALLATWSPLAVYFAWECLVWLLWGSSSKDEAQSAAQSAALSTQEPPHDGRTDGRTSDAPIAAPDAVETAAPSAAVWTQPTPHDDRVERGTEDAPNAATGAAKSPRPVRQPTTAERGKIDRRIGRMSGRKIAAETAVPEKVVLEYLRTREAPTPALVGGNGAATPPTAD